MATSKFTQSTHTRAVCSTSATTTAAQQAAAKAAAQNKKLQAQIAAEKARYAKLTTTNKKNAAALAKYKAKEASDKAAAEAAMIAAARSDEKAPTTDVKSPEDTGVKDPTDFQWNLPPHSWSLPVRPIELEVDPGGNGFLGGQYRKQPESFHGMRRGRVWSWAAPESLTKYDVEIGKSTSANDAIAKAGKADSNNSKILTPNYKYGFQFMWNPAELTSSVYRNMDVTPSAADKLRVVSGVFPGQETVSFNIMLDRTNDFACARGAQKTGAISELADFEKYYKNAYYPTSNTSVTFSEKMDALLKYGTMADLEYLFKSINGSGLGDGEWATLLGKKTANLGYLQPTLMAVTLGPDRTSSLSYVGWISSISMSHSSFTEDMIPLRTTVSFSVECFAGSGIGAGA
jgi:hypothetical protein